MPHKSVSIFFRFSGVFARTPAFFGRLGPDCFFLLAFLAPQFFLTARACAVDVEREEVGFERRVTDVAYRGYEAGVFYGAHFSACVAHEVVVAFADALRHALVLRGLVAELVTAHEAGFDEELYGCVDGGEAYMAADSFS